MHRGVFYVFACLHMYACLYMYICLCVLVCLHVCIPPDLACFLPFSQVGLNELHMYVEILSFIRKKNPRL